MDLLIRTQATGRPKEFADKMGISTRSLFNYLSFMKDQLSAPIKYSNELQSYYYEERGSIKMGWFSANFDKQ